MRHSCIAEYVHSLSTRREFFVTNEFSKHDAVSLIDQYYQKINISLQQIVEKETNKIKILAEKAYGAIRSNGLIYAFGTGHSHILVEEIFYRAGGIAPVYPVLIGSLMLHERAVLSSKLERIDGIGEAIASDLPISSRDVVVVFSNSGSNSVVVTFAESTKKIGAYVAAVTSVEHSKNVTARNELGKKLYEVADLTIDNHVPYGDASLKMNNITVGPLSTICGAFIIDSVMAEIVKLFEKDGIEPPVFLSANVPQGDEVNALLVEKYRKYIPML